MIEGLVCSTECSLAILAEGTYEGLGILIVIRQILRREKPIGNTRDLL